MKNKTIIILIIATLAIIHILQGCTSKKYYAYRTKKPTRIECSPWTGNHTFHNGMGKFKMN